MARKPRQPADLKRRANQRQPYDRVLIVCEGAKTEPVYFTDLKDHYGLSTANIAITPARGSDPVSVVKHAKALQQQEQRQGEQFDRVYCVFDRDEHSNFAAANVSLDSLRSKHFYAARSWPCFEYWLLLHYGYQRAPFQPEAGKTAAQVCQSMLKANLPSYSKGMRGVFSALLPTLDSAIAHAKRVEQDVTATGEANPSTEVHHLVEYLRELKQHEPA
ncbi:RloB family protein [Shewanella sp.]|uniref:RloB family protein n=1 Tax=Shewanella sp. TaxID=50422 RepID=UPI003F41321E